MKTRIFGFIFVMASLFFCSCTKNDVTTIILMGEENNVPDFNTMCPTALQKAMLQYGYNSNDTSFRLVTPQNVNGTYSVNGMYFLALNEVMRAGTDYEIHMSDFIDNLNALHSESLVLELTEQNNTSVKMHYKWFSGEDLTYEIAADNASVVGALVNPRQVANEVVYDTIFALYFECTKGYPVMDAGWDCHYHARELITGIIRNDGIKDFRFACLCHDKWGADDYVLQRVGDYRVTMDYNAHVDANYVTPRINK